MPPRLLRVRTDPTTPVTASSSRRAVVALVLLGSAAALALAACLSIDGALIDDAYITYRYAANLATGRGMVYNPGEWVLGTTTPAWAAVLSGAGALAGPAAIPAAARVLNGLLLVASGLVAARLGRRWSGSAPVGAAVGAGVMLAPHGLLSAAGGMESPLFNLLAFTALLGWAERRWWLAAAATGLAPLVRPEGALLVGLVGAAWLVGLVGRGRHAGPGGGSSGRSAWLPPLLLVLPGTILAGVLAILYGSPVPQSVRAKQAGIYPLTVAESAGETLAALRGVLTGAGLFAAVPGAAVAVLAAGSGWLVWRRRDLWMPVALLWGLLLFYATSRTTIFPHYIALLEPYALVAWGAVPYAVLASAARALGRRTAGGTAGEPGIRGGAGGGRLGPLVLAVVATLLLLRPLLLYPVASVLAGEPSLRDEVVGVPMMRTAFYRAAAEVVGPAIPAGTTVLMPEIGVPGFHLGHVRVLDAAGLVSPEAVPFLPVPPEERVGSGVGAIPSGLVRAEEPDLILTLELFARRSLYEDPWFADRYDTVWRWGDAEALPWGPLRIHARRGSGLGPRLRALPGGVR